MKITKEFPGLTQIANGDYVLEGDLVIEEPVVEMTIEEIEQKLGIKNLKIKER